MASEKKVKSSTRKRSSRSSVDVPSLFRINVEVGDLDGAAQFYEKLLGLVGRRQAGARCYFTCGAVTLQVVEIGRAHV